MQLLIAVASPFVRKVRVVLRETKQLADVEEVNVSTTPIASDPVVVAANPTGKIPALIRDDGPAIYDSRVITRYLDARAKANLYPENALWEVLTLEATADAIMDASVLLIYEVRFRPEPMQSADWMTGQWAKVTRGLDALESRWLSHLAGPLHMGQIGVGCALGYLDFRHPTYDWRIDHPGLAAWFGSFSQRDSMKDTAPV
jgi:glutathione S-transferase